MNNNILILDRIKEFSLLTKKQIYFGFKRLVDIFLSLIGIIFFVPIAIIVKIAYILAKDYNPIMFTHTRIGKNGEEFKMYKFRTMVPDAEKVLKKLLKNKSIKAEWEENHKLDNDPRITKIGRILRKTSLDEIPQVLNIFKGNMTIIGPRPLVVDEVEAYGSNKAKLLSVRPGLTGWWAVNGRSCTTNKKRMKLELYYVDNCSLILDLKIFFLTIIKVIKKDGAK